MHVPSKRYNVYSAINYCYLANQLEMQEFKRHGGVGGGGRHLSNRRK